MRRMSWHRFQPTSDDDSACTHEDCQVIVSDDALNLFSKPCPVPPCEANSNEGSPCVFVPGEHGPVCAYCEIGGALDMGLDDEDDDPDEEDGLTRTA